MKYIIGTVSLVALLGCGGSTESDASGKDAVVDQGPKDPGGGDPGDVPVADQADSAGTPDSSDASEVDMGTNVGTPCLKAVPTDVKFGAVLIAGIGTLAVTLESCGEKVVKITGIALAGDSSPDFVLEVQDLGDFSADQPLLLQPGATRTFSVKYLPESVDSGVDGKIVPDTGTILVDNSSVTTPIEIPVIGFGISEECLIAEFMIKHGAVEVKDGDDVLAQSTLDFIDQSYDPTAGGDIVGYERSVSKAPGSADVFDPSPTFPSPQFTANVVGDYLFRLEVTNDLDMKSCNKAEKLVHVKAGDGCHIELTWNTPTDPDPTDQCFGGKDCGSDMDLHVVHPLADTPDVDKDGEPDGFFDVKYDCFWFNPHPDWGSPELPDIYHPHLDKDDGDGAGPEIFTYDSPQKGMCYKVGVHYWDEHLYGASYPTIKVFVDGDLVYEKTSQKMQYMDMWEVGEACCNDKANPFIEYSKEGDVVIIHNYMNPDFVFTP